jgi:hypothetical protein
VRYVDGGLRIGSLTGAAWMLGYALRSTIRSPLFSKVTVFYRDLDFQGVEDPRSDRPAHRLSRAEMIEEGARHEGRFRLFRAMHRARDFQLVLCADVWDGLGEHSMRILKAAVAEQMSRSDGSVYPEPLVVYSPRGSRQQLVEPLAAPLDP